MVRVLKNAASVAWDILAFLFAFAAAIFVLGLLVYAGELVMKGVGRAYDWAVAPAPCGAASASVTRLLETLEGGELVARRRAIARLRCAAPADFVEFDRLVLAARGADRRRLREAAIESLGRARQHSLKRRAAILASDNDDRLARAGFDAARGMGLSEDGPELRDALAWRPSWRTPRPEAPEAAVDPKSAARFAARAARINDLLAKADVTRFREFQDQARKAAVAGDWGRVEALLKMPDFIVGGAQAGAALGALGPGAEARAQALAQGTDPVLSDVGRGWLVALGQRAPGAQVQGRGAK